jgi:hypothetical protein
MSRLKSSARLVGALNLSEKAKALEKAGNDGDIDKIRSDSLSLLEEFRSYGTGEAEKSDPGTDRPLIEKGELEEAFEGIREFAEAFDFGSANGILSQLEDYRMAEEDRKKYLKLKKMVEAADRDGIISTLVPDQK